MPPLFRLSFHLELPGSSDQHCLDNSIALEPPDSNVQSKPRNRSVRQHPRFSLRVAALIALVLGIILNAVILSTYGNDIYTVRSLTGWAEIIMIISLAYQLSDLYSPPYAFPKWTLLTAEILSFLIYGTMFGFNVACIDQMLGPYYPSEVAVLMAYNSGVWVVNLLIHAILTIQFLTQRPPSHRCVDCAHTHSNTKSKAKAKPPAIGNGDGEGAETEALIDTEARKDGEQHPTEGYRDEEGEGNAGPVGGKVWSV